MRYLVIAFAGYLLGFHNGWYVKDWFVQDENFQHTRRCQETTKYWQWPGHDPISNTRLCFRQSKKTERLERTTLVYDYD